MTPLQREALQMCLEYIETDAHERRHVRWKINEALAEPATEEFSAVQPAAQPQQEPVAWRVKWPAIGGGHKWLMVDRPLMEKEGFVNEALYTSPPAQEFVCSTGLCHYRKPLTDEEIEEMMNDLEEGYSLYRSFARAIEAAHGITATREHVTDDSQCWCNPEITYTDPDTGVSVIVHKEPQ